MASIAATGFGLTALCIADRRGYLPHDQVVERVQDHPRLAPEQDSPRCTASSTTSATSRPASASRASNSPPSILASCSAASSPARPLPSQRANSPRSSRSNLRPRRLALDVQGRPTFSMGWQPEQRLPPSRWEHLLRAHDALPARHRFAHSLHSRLVLDWPSPGPYVHYEGFRYICGRRPSLHPPVSPRLLRLPPPPRRLRRLLRQLRPATRAHKAFCLAFNGLYSEDCWGISASDSASATAPGEARRSWPVDGTVVPCAAAGSLAFLPDDCLHVLGHARPAMASAPGAATASVTPSTPPPTGTTPMSSALTRASPSSWLKIFAPALFGTPSCAIRKLSRPCSALAFMARDSRLHPHIFCELPKSRPMMGVSK